jgi:aminobenzoyl-glutamate utilization protein A
LHLHNPITRCPRPGPTVALRFDIDALPIQEAGPPHRPSLEGWASQLPGVMHACGHDGHIAIGLGLAQMLAPRLNRGRGTLKLIFQPAEEGTRGARAVVEAGHLDDVDVFLSLHLGFGIPSGAVALGTHGFLATRKFQVTYLGAPAHAGKEPEAGRNALLAAAQAVLGLHALAQHSEPGVRVNVGKLEAGLAANIVPDRAMMHVELRAPTQQILDVLAARASTLIEGTASAYAALSSQITLTGEATAAATDPDLATWAAALARSVSLFEEFEMRYSFGGSEDATLMMRRVQERGGRAGYFVLGADLSSPHHTSAFDFDESALSSGVALLALIVASALDLW